MTGLTRWNPFQELQTLQSQLNRLFYEPFGWTERPTLSGTWVPPVDVEETADKLFVRAEVPGMKPEDFDIQYENGILTIRGERKFDSETTEKNFHRIERSYGSFVRSFTLPTSIDAEHVKARYENGVLELEMPKHEAAKPRRISVGTGKPLEAEKAKVKAA